MPQMWKAVKREKLLTAGFTIMGNGTESFPMVVVICIAKIAMIFGGGCLLIHGQEDEEC